MLRAGAAGIALAVRSRCLPTRSPAQHDSGSRRGRGSCFLAPGVVKYASVGVSVAARSGAQGLRQRASDRVPGRRAAELRQDGAARRRDARAARAELDHIVINTGQHYDPEMSEIFLDELEHRAARLRARRRIGDTRRSDGPGARADRVGARGAPTRRACRPGDVNSTLAGALAAAKLGIPIAHLEAGLRSFDRTMPEEINRVLTDQLSTWCFTHSPEAAENLAREGIDASTRVLRRQHDDRHARPDEAAVERSTSSRSSALEPGGYILVTLHRPALVDGPDFDRVLASLARLADWTAGRLPGPSADAGAIGAERDHPGAAADRPCRLRRLPRARGARARGRHRLRRRPGGDDLPRGSVLHDARQHRTTGHGHAGHEPPHRHRSRRARRRPGCARGRSPPAERPQGWDGHAAGARRRDPARRGPAGSRAGREARRVGEQRPAVDRLPHCSRDPSRTCWPSTTSRAASSRTRRGRRRRVT